MSIRISRRLLLKAGLVTGLLALLGAIYGRWKGVGTGARVAPLSDAERAVLISFLDSFIPTDEAPGALDLGVQHALLERVGRNRYLRQRFRQGVSWLNRQAEKLGGEEFSQLPPARREQIIHLAEHAAPHTPEFKFYLRFRHEAFRLYYADARSWPSLCYQGPPQPRGFPDYQQPPSACGPHEDT